MKLVLSLDMSSLSLSVGGLVDKKIKLIINSYYVFMNRL